MFDELIEYSRFCIFPDHTFIVTSRSKFNSDEFIDVFVELFKINTLDFVNLAINYRRDDDDIFNIIYNFKKLIGVEIKNLRKSNPNPKPTFEKIEKFLEEEQTDEFSAEFKSDDISQLGLNRNIDSIIMSAISLTDSGYGNSKIVGIEKNGEIRVIKTKDKIIQKVILKKPREEYLEFIKLIKIKFSQYIRTSKNE